MITHNIYSLRETRRNLRNNATPAELRLWQELKGHQMEGRKFRRQHGIGRYIVDFFCPSLKLIIEIDGGIHTERDVMILDKQREKELVSAGFTVIRFSNEEVSSHIDCVLQKIQSFCIANQ